MMGNLSTRAGAAAAATGGAVGGGLIGGVLGGAAGGAVGYGASYASQKAFTNNDAKWDWTEFGMASLKGGVSGMVGGGVGALGSGASGAMLGGFFGGATGSALNGEDPWGTLKGGLLGAGIALGSYSATAGVKAYKDYRANERARATIAKETGFDIRGIDDLYNSQNSIDPNSENAEWQEYYIKDDDVTASKGIVHEDENKNLRNNIKLGQFRTMHAHGPNQKVHTPSPGDLYTAAANSGSSHYMLDTPSLTIYKYNGDNINGNLDYAGAGMAAEEAYNSGKNIEQTWAYKPHVGYGKYFRGYFQW